MDPSNKSNYLSNVTTPFSTEPWLWGKESPTLHPLVHDCCFTVLFVLFTLQVWRSVQMRCTTISSTLCSSGEGLHVPQRSRRGGGFPPFTEASGLWRNKPIARLFMIGFENPSMPNCNQIEWIFCAFGRYCFWWNILLKVVRFSKTYPRNLDLNWWSIRLSLVHYLGLGFKSLFIFTPESWGFMIQMSSNPNPLLHIRDEILSPVL